MLLMQIDSWLLDMNDCEDFSLEFSFLCMLLAVKVDTLGKENIFFKKCRSGIDVYHFSQVKYHTELYFTTQGF